MNPRDLESFATEYLEPRLPWLTRRDLPWDDPSPEAFVCPVEFVAAPIEWIKCSLTLNSPPALLGRERYTLVGFRFVALWTPEAPDGDLGVNRPGHGPLARLATFRHRWAMGADAGADVADELARAAQEQWPAALRKLGDVESYFGAVKGDAETEPSWPFGREDPATARLAEAVAYAPLLLGDPSGAQKRILRLRRRDGAGAAGSRAAQIERNLSSHPGAAVDLLYEWRRARLEAEGLLGLAAPRGFAAARRAASSAGGEP
jgi:hypothetical protein